MLLLVLHNVSFTTQYFYFFQVAIYILQYLGSILKVEFIILVFTLSFIVEHRDVVPPGISLNPDEFLWYRKSCLGHNQDMHEWQSLNRYHTDEKTAYEVI